MENEMRYKGHLTRTERQVIHGMRGRGKSFREIGDFLGRDKSVVCRELKRNKLPAGMSRYMTVHEKAAAAHKKALRRRSESKRVPRGSIKSARVREHICFELKENGSSPEAIAAELSMLFPEDRISGKTIRRWIKAQVPELIQCLREKGKKRRNRVVTRRTRKKASPPKVMIDERPGVVDEHIEAGHIEIDLVVCSQSTTSILTIRELKTRHVTLMLVSNRQAETVNGALAAYLCQLPPKLRKTITEDNGSEFEHTYKLKKRYGIEIYNCHPYCSWEKGSVENANRLIREYLPKGTNLATVTWSELKEIEKRINNRPMLCLGYLRPINAFQNELALAA